MSSSKSKATSPALDAVSASSSALPQFEPYESPAGGWGASQATAKALREQSVILKGGNALPRRPNRSPFWSGRNDERVTDTRGSFWAASVYVFERSKSHDITT
jgi:hypothetical protein